VTKANGPRFKPGDLVIVDWHGRGRRIWRVIGTEEPLPWSTAASYVLMLEDGGHRRTALESALKPADPEAPA
jgi:hypothetical protein